MNITKENVDALNAVVTIQVGPSDYEARVNKALKDYSKRVSMPGFRPGMVPMGMVKKMYGTSIMVEEINRHLSEELFKYIEAEKLEILGQPLPSKESVVDFENQKEFTFKYDLGLVPTFDVDLSKLTVDYTRVDIDAALVDKYLKDVRRNFGKPSTPEVAEAHDVLFTDANQLEADGTITAGGIFKALTLSPERLKSEEAKKKLIGAKKDDKIVINVNVLYPEKLDLGIQLGIDKEAAEALNCDLQLTVKSLARLEDAPVDQELFDKVYGEGTITDEAAFRAKIAEELQNAFENDSDKRFYGEVEKQLLEKHQFALPDAFLKRWIKSANDKPVTEEQIENEYEAYSKFTKWKLIEGKLIKAHEIIVTQEEAKADVEAYVRSQYARYGQLADDNEITKTTMEILTKEEEARKVFESLYERKLMITFKSTIKLNENKVSYNDFFGIKE